MDRTRWDAGRALALVVTGTALLLAGCSHAPKAAEPGAPAAAAPAPKRVRVAPDAGVVVEAQITPTQGSTCRGTVRFEGQPDGTVKVTADLTGLEPNTKHGIHVHETGDCSAPDAMSAGAHFNPTQREHGLPPAEERHAGDLGNLTSDGDGKAHYEITVNTLSLGNAATSVVGRAVIVHAKPDDGGQPAGNSGARVGCGVIASPGPAPRN